MLLNPGCYINCKYCRAHYHHDINNDKRVGGFHIWLGPNNARETMQLDPFKDRSAPWMELEIARIERRMKVDDDDGACAMA